MLWILGMVGAVLTAFYMFRLVFMTFHGEFRGGEEAEHHLHESPWTMTMPLVVLGVLSIFGGFVGIPGKLFGHPEWNLIERFLEPILLPIGHAAEGGHDLSHHAVSLGIEWGLVLPVGGRSPASESGSPTASTWVLRRSCDRNAWPSVSRSLTSCCSTSTGWTRSMTPP